MIGSNLCRFARGRERAQPLLENADGFLKLKKYRLEGRGRRAASIYLVSFVRFCNYFAASADEALGAIRGNLERREARR